MNHQKLILCLIAGFLMLTIFTGCGSEKSEETGGFTESEVSFQTEDSRISGTLAVPDGEGPFPAVIVLAGSGAFDRNGDMDPRALQAMGRTSFAANSTYRDIAHGLSQAGILTLRYDKREIGGSTGEGAEYPEDPEPSLRDLGAALTFLRNDPRVDKEHIGLLGHSLGGLWALMEAAEDPDIAAVCVMATPAKPWSEVIIEQIEGLGTLRGANETQIAATIAQQEEIYRRLRSGELEATGSLEFLKVMLDVAGADYAREIECPALILQGEKDLFTIIPSEAQLLKEAFNEGGNDDVELIVFDNLDHWFRITPGQPSLDLFFEDRGPIPADVVQTIVEWMETVLR